ncbi:MAG: FAD-binding oxidoreductase, partial [Candidatus Rokuibacteriota bacterium]
MAGALRPKLLSELRPGTRIVSHDSDMGDWQPEKTVRLTTSRGEHVVYYAHHGFEYWRQPPTGELLFGGCRWAEEPAHECGVDDDTCVSERIFAAQRDFVRRHLPRFAALPVTSTWAGIMAFTRDGLPLVGAVPGGRRRQLVCAGWNGHGLAQAPLSARIIAESILG